MSKLQEIKTISDFQSFGPTADATSSNCDDLSDLDCIFGDSVTDKLSVVEVHQNRALAIVLQHNENPENVFHCPIDHSGNSKVETTQEQTWMLYAPVNSNFAIAFNDSGAYLIEPK